jgi:hypothetical protein
MLKLCLDTKAGAQEEAEEACGRSEGEPSTARYFATYVTRPATVYRGGGYGGAYIIAPHES